MQTKRSNFCILWWVLLWTGLAVLTKHPEKFLTLYISISQAFCIRVSVQHLSSSHVFPPAPIAQFGTVFWRMNVVLYLPHPVCHITVTIVMPGRLVISRPSSSVSWGYRWKARSVTKLRAVRAGIHRFPAPHQPQIWHPVIITEIQFVCLPYLMILWEVFAAARYVRSSSSGYVGKCSAECVRRLHWCAVDRPAH